jgi:hypothetical protein
MACFITPTVVTVVTKKIAKRVPEKYHIEWLLTMLWGGVAMLAVEHIAHQEVVPYFPFLTAMKNPHDTLVMLKEMAIVGGTMTLAIFVAWIALAFTASLINDYYGKKQIKTIQA